MSRKKGQLSKLIPGADPEKQLLSAQHGTLADINPEACKLAGRLLDDLHWSIIEDEIGPPTIARSPKWISWWKKERQRRRTVRVELAQELLDLCQEVLKRGRGGFLTDLAHALDQIHTGAVDRARTAILELKAAGVKEKPIFRMIIEEEWGTSVSDHQLRRMLNDCGVNWKKGKAGRPRGS